MFDDLNLLCAITLTIITAAVIMVYSVLMWFEYLELLSRERLKRDVEMLKVLDLAMLPAQVRRSCDGS